MIQAPVTRTQKAAPYPVQAPTGGLNAVSALASMPAQDASLLTNMFPYSDRVESRPGFATLATATPVSPTNGVTAIEGFRTLMSRENVVYGSWYWSETVGGVNYSRLRIYSISAAGALANVREVVTTAGTNSIEGIGEWVNFTSAAGTKYLLAPTAQMIAAVGTYVMTAFDGSSWSTPSITGVPPTTLGLAIHRKRLWFYGAINTTNLSATKPLSAYYLPVGAVSGAVTEFNIGAFASRGGAICAIRTWTIDGGDGGTDDLIAFLTTNGQLILYSGNDPASLSTWALVGVFDVAEPASYMGSSVYSDGFSSFDVKTFVKDSFAMKYGADLLLILTAGISTAAGVLRPSDVNGDYSISAKIRPLLTAIAQTASAAAGNIDITQQWKMVYLPTRKHLIVAVPTAWTSSVTSNVRTANVSACTIFAMNAESGSWCQFSGMNVFDAIPVGNNMYFIDGSQKVYKYGVSTSDDGTAIGFECRQAYNYLESPVNKLATLMQPMLYSAGVFSARMTADADFVAGTISTLDSYLAGNNQPWLSPNQYGRALAAHLKGQSSAAPVAWYATNWVFRNAGII